MEKITCFKSYDVRGKVPEELNIDVAYRIGKAYAQHLQPKTVAIGYDIRLTSPEISKAVAKGLTDSGVNVIDIGQCGTEEVYFASTCEGIDGGICVTASHNPKNYNGMKFVSKNAVPISGDSGLRAIQTLAEKNEFKRSTSNGVLSQQDFSSIYLKHLLSYVTPKNLPPFKIVVNAGNGGAGKIVDLLEPNLPFDFIKLNHKPDGHFPNGVPNPLLIENRLSTQQSVIEHKANLGVAWDGDFDRCFFFDEKGHFIEGYYLVGLLAKTLLEQNTGATIIYDPRLYWNTLEMIKDAGGKAVKSKTGHAFIKETMRIEDAIYGGEMSAHHYFKSFSYCDNGNIPWLLICNLMATSGKKLSELVSERMELFPCSGEINLTVNNAETLLKEMNEYYQHEAIIIDHTDGLGVEFSEWRFNVRSSNTEPLLRVNIETRGDKALLQQKTDELLAFIHSSNNRLKP